MLHADIDECVETPGVCHQNATCINSNGSFSCQCNDGFTRDGEECNGMKILMLEVMKASMTLIHTPIYIVALRSTWATVLERCK